MNLTFQYKLNLTTKQIKIFDNILAGQRILYNAALQERNDAYKKKNISISKFEQYKHLSEIKQDVPVNIQRWTLTEILYNSGHNYKNLHSKIWVLSPPYTTSRTIIWA